MKKVLWIALKLYLESLVFVADGVLGILNTVSPRDDHLEEQNTQVEYDQPDSGKKG